MGPELLFTLFDLFGNKPDINKQVLQELNKQGQKKEKVVREDKNQARDFWKKVFSSGIITSPVHHEDGDGKAVAKVPQIQEKVKKIPLELSEFDRSLSSKELTLMAKIHYIKSKGIKFDDSEATVIKELRKNKQDKQSYLKNIENQFKKAVKIHPKFLKIKKDDENQELKSKIQEFCKKYDNYFIAKINHKPHEAETTFKAIETGIGDAFEEAGINASFEDINLYWQNFNSTQTAGEQLAAKLYYVQDIDLVQRMIKIIPG